MRYKVVPPVRDVEFLYEAAEALPLVPGSVEDCCTRIRDETNLPSRDVAREFLTFLEALGLASEADRGYHRVRNPPGEADLAVHFQERVYAVEEVLAALDAVDDPLDAARVFEEVRDVVPRWERDRHANWEAVWTNRVERLLDWADVFDLVTRTDEGYRRT